MVLRGLRRVLPGTVVSSTASSASTAAEPRPPERSESAGAAGGDGPDDPLSVCLLSYRSDPYSGGQGVYVRYLSRALANRGHSVDVVSGKPYPDLDDDVSLVELPGENVVDRVDRLRAFEPSYLRNPLGLFEWASALTGGFPDPYAFGKRAVSYLEDHGDRYDVVHDNQSLCYGLLDLDERGFPTVATVHHPITVDREMDLADADGVTDRLLVRRWYRFLSMQRSVVADLDHLIAVSDTARRRTVEDFGADPDAVDVVYNGIDTDLFAPRPSVERASRRVMTTVSADVPIKGVRHLLDGFASVRERKPDAELVVVGEFDEGGTAADLVAEYDLGDAIETHTEIGYGRMVDLYASSTLAVVPSLYEGFGLPAGEAMACGVPVVSTSGGALPEVVGDAGVLVPTGDSAALADAICDLFEDPERRRRLGERGRERVLSAFDWDRTAAETVETYRRAIEATDE